MHIIKVSKTPYHILPQIYIKCVSKTLGIMSNLRVFICLINIKFYRKKIYILLFQFFIFYNLTFNLKISKYIKKISYELKIKKQIAYLFY